MPKVHIENTNLPMHLEEMLKLLIDEDHDERNEIVNATADETTNSINSKTIASKQCFDFVLTNRPIDLLTDICLTDSPPGASVCILNWMRRFLTCLEKPKLDHKSILQPIQVIFKSNGKIDKIKKKNMKMRIILQMNLVIHDLFIFSFISTQIEIDCLL